MEEISSLDINIENGVLAFRYVRALLSLMGVFFIISIWRDSLKVINTNKKDIGHLAIAAALLCWTIIDILYIWYYYSEGEIKTMSFHTWFSTANNFLLLASINYHRYKPSFLKNRQRPELVALLCLVIVMVSFPIIQIFWEKAENLLSLIDFIITSITYVLLAIIISMSFYKRKYSRLFLAGVFIIFIVFIVTQYSVFSSKKTHELTYNYVFYLSSQIGFVVLVIIHAQSWLDELIKENLQREEKREVKIIKEQSDELIENLKKNKEKEVKTIKTNLEKAYTEINQYKTRLSYSIVENDNELEVSLDSENNKFNFRFKLFVSSLDVQKEFSLSIKLLNSSKPESFLLYYMIYGKLNMPIKQKPKTHFSDIHSNNNRLIEHLNQSLDNIKISRKDLLFATGKTAEYIFNIPYRNITLNFEKELLDKGRHQDLKNIFCNCLIEKYNIL